MSLLDTPPVRPLGAPLPDWSPPPLPTRKPLAGRYVTLEPLDPQRHGAALFAAGHGPGAESLWTYLPYGPFESADAMAPWLETMARSTDPLAFAIRPVGGPPQGMCTFLRIAPAAGSIEIGSIWFGPALQRTRAATEAIALLMREAMDGLGYRRLEWKCNALNAASRRAAERFGFRFEGVFRQHMVVKGRNRDTAWFSLLDHEWPAVAAAFDAWLDPDNFDTQGRQIAPLRCATRQEPLDHD